MKWSFDKRILDDRRDYLVRYMQPDGRYSNSHRAYWVHEEGKFFSCENQNSYPIVADIWLEIPDHDM